MTADGYRLPLHRWLPPGEIKAVVLGLHGFNDYGNEFRYLREALVETGGMAIYAYDQRGFGATERPGIWAGQETLVGDARTVIGLLHARYPEKPFFLIGESMGAAVVLLALADRTAMPVDGAVLIAPAVWGTDATPWYHRLGLWLAVRLMPGKYFSSETLRLIGKRPTDDAEVMRERADDPRVLKGARVDALQGASELLEEASRAVSVPVPLQTLYGLNDQIIPSAALCNWLQRLAQPTATAMRLVLYPDGYHWLTRYSGRAHVIADIAAWLNSSEATLPSGNELELSEAQATVCAGT